MEDYIDPFLRKDAFLMIYSEQLCPIPDEIMWPLVLDNDMQPPEVKRQVGRPKLARRRAADKLQPMKRSCSVRCTICNE